jgi:hypothetical protein
VSLLRNKNDDGEFDLIELGVVRDAAQLLV